MKKIKKYFTEKPKGNIWKKATIYLILLKYIGPLALIFIVCLMLGLASPSLDATVTINETSQAIANAYSVGMTSLFETGQTIATNNPILSKVLFFIFGNVVYVFYAGMFYLIMDILRHITSWAYNRKKRFVKLGDKE